MSTTGQVSETVSPEAVRFALRRMAKSVTVITCVSGGIRYAMAATAADALSMAPPAMLISVNQSSSLHRPLTDGANFCINVLARTHEEISRACGGGRSGEERFEVGHWIEGVEGVPMLADASASFVCRNESAMTYGSHSIFIGQVLDVQTNGEVDPLIYLDGRYLGIATTAS